MPRRIRIRQLSQLSDAEGAIIVAAPSRWVVPPQVHRRPGASFGTVLEWFREWLTTDDHPNAIAMRASLPQLRGRDLACWCPLDAPCHADVLLELANATNGDMMEDGRREGDPHRVGPTERTGEWADSWQHARRRRA